MTHHHSHAEKVQIRFLDGPGPQQPVVSRAWLPMAVWDGVRVLVNTRQGLTAMETFAIEALLMLGDCDDGDLNAIAGIPPQVGSWILASLEQKKLAIQGDNLTYTPVEVACREALASGSVVTQHEERRVILCFPETGEFIVLSESDSVLRMLRDTVAVGGFPWPEQLVGKNHKEALDHAISQGRLYGEDAHSISCIVEAATVIDGMCPAYQVSTLLPQLAPTQWKLTFWGKSLGARGRPARTEGQSDRGNPSLIGRPMHLPVLPHVAHAWLSNLEGAFSSVMAKLAALGIGQADIQSGSVAAAIDGMSAGRFGRHALLTVRTGMAIIVDPSIEYEIPLVLMPSDDSARSQFMVDESVQTILRASSPPEALALICGDDSLLRMRIIDRMWAIRLYRVIYEIREAEDFV